jgi:amino acid adenylation domain-containing protein
VTNARFEFAVDLSSAREPAKSPYDEFSAALSVGQVVDLLLTSVRIAQFEPSLRELECHDPLTDTAAREAYITIEATSGRVEFRSRGVQGLPAPARLHWTARIGSGRVPIALTPGLDGTVMAPPLSEIGPWFEGGVARGYPRLVGLGCEADTLRFDLEFGDDVHPAPDEPTRMAALADVLLRLAGEMVSRSAPHASHVARLAGAYTETSSVQARVTAYVQREAGTDDGTWRVWATNDSGALVLDLAGVEFLGPTQIRARRVGRCAARVLEIARDVTGLEALTEETDLVSAGASSLAMVSIVAAMAEEWGAAPPLDLVLVAPTPVEIARHQIEGEASAFVRFTAAATESACASADVLSNAEQRLWYLERYADVAPAYNEAVTWCIEGPLDVEALASSLQSVASRHEALRTSFEELGGEARRRVAADPEWPLEVRAVEAADADAALDRTLSEEARRPFQLETAPLVRAILYRLGEARHVLQLVAHHVICDGWSLAEVLSTELAAQYAAFRKSGAAARLASPLQMRAYAAWEQGLPAAVREHAIEWWAAELEGVPTVLELPVDRPRPQRQSHRGAITRFEVDPTLTARLRSAARELRATPFVLLLGAFETLVHRYTGRSRFVLGIPFSLRLGPELESAVGCLINTVPLRADVDPGASLSELVADTRTRVARAHVHTIAPFDELVRRLRCDRSLSRTPLIQVAFGFHESGPEALLLDGCSVQPIATDPCTAKFDLTLQVLASGGRLHCEIEYATDLFDPRRIARMARHYMIVLHQLVADARVEVGGAWFIDEREREELTRCGQGPQTELAAGAVREAIAERFARRTSRTAVVAGAERVSDTGLAQQSERIAALIGSRASVGAAPVALCLGRSVSWTAALLALLRLGRGYLPIDPQSPKERALRTLRECGADLLLYAGESCPWHTEFAGEALDIGAPLPPMPAADAVATPPPDATLYAITTSGSTGAPKTAAVSNAGFANLCDWYGRTLELTDGDRVLIATSVAFDLTQKNVFAALARGGALVLRSEQRFDPAEIRGLIERERVTIVNCTPSLFYALIEPSTEAVHAQLRSLRWVVLGGEPVERSRIASWLADPACSARLMNSYGPTECTDVVTACEVLSGGSGPVPIGKPIYNAVVSARDARGGYVPRGVTGELWISGAAVGKGYLGAPPPSQNGFVRDKAEGIAYRTGDLVYLDWDDQWVFVGRADRQVKLRGYRIELGEVEAVLRTCPGVSDAAVIADDPGGPNARLHAFYVARAEIAREVLRALFEARLPRYMIPASFTRLTELPLTRSGKLDRWRLPLPHSIPRELPQGLFEQRLHALWQELLGVGELGVDDDFFDCGGHSLLAIRLAEKIETAFDLYCSVGDVFEHPTVRSLARLLARRGV